MRQVLGKSLMGAFLTVLFLLPFFGWIAAEPVPYREPTGLFAIDVPDGWIADDSGYMGKGVIMKGPAGPAGVEPVVHLIHEEAGIVTLDVQWPTHLGRLRYELEKVKFAGLEDFDDAKPPYSQARYSFAEGESTRSALTRMYLHEKRFYLLTATAPEEEFDGFLPLFQGTFDSLQFGKGE